MQGITLSTQTGESVDALTTELQDRVVAACRGTRHRLADEKRWVVLTPAKISVENCVLAKFDFTTRVPIPGVVQIPVPYSFGTGHMMPRLVHTTVWPVFFSCIMLAPELNSLVISHEVNQGRRPAKALLAPGDYVLGLARFKEYWELDEHSIGRLLQEFVFPGLDKLAA